MRIIDTYEKIGALYDPEFDLDKWKQYAEAISPGLAALCTGDTDEYLSSGAYSWEKDFLPVLNGVFREKDLCREAHASFLYLTGELEQRIAERFGRVPEVDLILYVGLCNGAGWVTTLADRDVVLLGLEKIVELRWCGVPEMTGLLFHELGHVYQAQFGTLEREPEEKEDAFLWQLFTEGIAMVFEQEIAGDPDLFHQDRDGWKTWCAEHLEEMKRDFVSDLPGMDRFTQRWFGDWTSYRGIADAGYYLGTQFVRQILKDHPFDEVIRFDIPRVRAAFAEFTACTGREKD